VIPPVVIHRVLAGAVALPGAEDGLALECVSNAGRCNFEWIRLHFKAIFRRLSGAKSRRINAEMQAKTPKLRFRHFRNTL
jgi:hypothetical protein